MYYTVYYKYKNYEGHSSLCVKGANEDQAKQMFHYVYPAEVGYWITKIEAH